MVLEALAALGIASAVVSFVDFSIDITSKGKEYYKSVDGRLMEHVELQGIAERLKDLSVGIRRSLSSLPDAKLLSAEEKALKSVAQRCQVVARELKEALEKLQTSGACGKFKNFRQALKTQWTKSEIEDRQRRLKLIREELVLHLVVVMKLVSSKLE